MIGYRLVIIQAYNLKSASAVLVIVLDVVQVFHHRVIYKPGILQVNRDVESGRDFMQSVFDTNEV